MKISGARLKILNEILLPLTSALCVTLLADTLIKMLGALPSLVYIILICLISIPVYAVLLFLFGSMTRDDIRLAVR